MNARGDFPMSREAARAMVAAGQGGHIINVVSAPLVGSIVKTHAAPAFEAAEEGMSRTAALDLFEHGITVNTALPGGVISPGAMAIQGPSPYGPAMRPPLLT